MAMASAIPLAILITLFFQVNGLPVWLYALGAVSVILGQVTFVDQLRLRRPDRRSGRAATVAESSAAAVVDVRVVLPDHWWAIPLQPPEARKRSVERLVERQFAGVDDQPLLRANTCRQLLAQAETAADSDGRLLALSLQRVADVPVPASLVVHWIDLPAGPDSTPGDGSLLAGLQAAFEPDAVAPGFALDLGKTAAGTVLRRVHEMAAELTGAELPGAEPTPSLVADYWLERPDGAGLVQLAFATPMLPLRQPLLELFDAVAGTLRWVTANEPEMPTTLPADGCSQSAEFDVRAVRYDSRDSTVELANSRVDHQGRGLRGPVPAI